MTRIAVVEPDGAGGMIHYAYQMCTALAAAGADVTLITSTSYELAAFPHSFRVVPMMRLWPPIQARPRRSRPAAAAAAVGRKLRRVWRGLRYAWEWNRVTGRILADHPDIAQFAVIRFPFQAFSLRRLRRAGITLGQVCHEFEPREAGRITRWVNRTLSTGVYRCFDVIFLHARENAERFLDRFPIDPAVVRVVPHGNEAMFLQTADAGGDLRHLYAIPPERPVALFFGGMRPSKGLPDLIAAFAMARSEMDAHLLIAGPAVGIDPDELRREVQRLGISDRSTIDPRYLPIAEVGPLLRTASVVVLPYRTATASGVLQVAYAFERPVIATAIGALADDVVHGETGLLVPPADPEAMAAALVKLLGDPAEANAMGRRGHNQAMTTFAWEPIAGALLNAYRELRS
ncbi:MAG: glycosyltransferase family 4 protein [Actinomycetota bacterium]